MLDVGDIVEHYRVEARLLVGGPAFGYRVRDVRLGSLHTLKVMVGATPVDRERLLAEGKIQTRLRHPNLVGVTDVFAVRGAPAVVLEHIEGPTLESWLAEGRISVDIALAMFRGIVTGVGVAHAAGVVHRGLQPSSVLLGRGRSGALVAKVTDFGLAIGVSRYSAPEQWPADAASQELRDPGTEDVRVDLWALGCVLYELVCGIPAFTATDPRRLREAVEAAAYPDPYALLAPRSPTRVTDGIRQLLEPDPNARIRSCAELWGRLWDVAVPTELTTEITQPMNDDDDQHVMDATHVWEGPDGSEEAPEAFDDDSPIVLEPIVPEAPTVPLPAEDSGLHPQPWPLEVQHAEAAWMPTPSTIDRRPPAPIPPRASGLWYVGAILAAGLPAGLFALIVAALVMEQTGSPWLERWPLSLIGRH
jgi:eukaryotic-like serine/threonine-protein kinase